MKSWSKIGRISLNWYIVRQHDYKIIRHRSTTTSKTELSNTTASTPSIITEFDNYKAAYGSKTTWELIRALSVFYMCRTKLFTDYALQTMKWTYKILGQRLGDKVIGKLVYEQFAAGIDEQSIKSVADRLRKSNVGTILAVPIEDDVEESQRSKDDVFDVNLQKIISCIKHCLTLKDPYPMFQLKVTALLSGDLAKTISSLIKEPEHKKLSSFKSLDDVDKDYRSLVDVFTAALSGKKLEIAKISGWEQVLSAEDQTQLEKAIHRLAQITQLIKDNEIIGMVDAEYTYMNPLLRLLALAMMQVCNTTSSKVSYTYQAYLKRTPEILQNDIQFSKDHNFRLGAKLVRGAYIVKERYLAKAQGYEDPVCTTLDVTCSNYHQCFDLLLSRLQEDPISVRLVIASHNELSIGYVTKRLSEMAVANNCSSVFFGQLYGMADHVSFTLGKNGYNTYKSLPYGNISETLPYLSRRAQENKSILENARRERVLVTKALKGRLFKTK